MDWGSFMNVCINGVSGIHAGTCLITGMLMTHEHVDGRVAVEEVEDPRTVFSGLALRPGL
jgi:hypothetical protein